MASSRRSAAGVRACSVPLENSEGVPQCQLRRRDRDSFSSPHSWHSRLCRVRCPGWSRTAAAEPLDVALGYLEKNADDLGVTSADVADLAVTSQFRSSHNGVTHVNLNQRVDGLEVFGAHVTVNVAADGGVVFAGGSLVPLGATSGGASFRPPRRSRQPRTGSISPSRRTHHRLRAGEGLLGQGSQRQYRARQLRRAALRVFPRLGGGDRSVQGRSRRLAQREQRQELGDGL